MSLSRIALTQLTEWETGEPLLIDLGKCSLVQRLPAEVYELSEGVRELGARTKIIIGNATILVRESVQEIQELQGVSDEPV